MTNLLIKNSKLGPSSPFVRMFAACCEVERNGLQIWLGPGNHFSSRRLFYVVWSLSHGTYTSLL